MRLHPFRLLAPAAIVVSSLAMPAAAQETVDLAPKFKVGQEARYTIDLNGTQQMTAQGMPDLPARTTKQFIGVLARTKETPAAGGAVVELVYEKLSVDIKEGEQGVVFNSESPADQDGNNPMAGILRPVIGKSLTLTLDPSGNITAVTGDEKIPGALRDAASAKNLYGALFTTWRKPTTDAGSKAAVGDTWTHEDSEQTEEAAPIKQVMTHKLDSIKGSDAQIAITGKVEVGPADGAQAPPFTIVESKQTGTSNWDAAAGNLKSLFVEMTLELKDSSQGMETTQKSKQTVKIMRLDGPAPAAAPTTPSAPAAPAAEKK